MKYLNIRCAARPLYLFIRSHRFQPHDKRARANCYYAKSLTNGVRVTLGRVRAAPLTSGLRAERDPS